MVQISAVFTCWLSKCVLKQDFLDGYLTTSFAVRNLENIWAMRVMFIPKCSKINLDFRNAAKTWDFGFIDNDIWIRCSRFSPLRREYLSSAVNVLIKCNKMYFRYHWRRHFPTQYPSEWLKNMIKGLCFRFQQYLGPFSMFPVEQCFETQLFRYLSNHVFCSL